ncbi:NADH-quinone oxidoreductase subunit G [Intrasporangium calvum]|uniref:NADH-quinone oxidoreductase n=1 Tax=Intrasporangium calvum (strain ATCC 23552 / DSM 43043 / JCM 3097 / NBRC 12989 / NCIMB 10167 / NRRL B-3866 / 7 KIP) TaxID=710696 RepID=E6SAI6_INTC7|nr:NADH-quinone oxidoreductase subunit G [Intrasporangium calvum]ADU47236.1 NADH dehydrogenase subunit G [Intrasporangium calvum DSM 43043]AXG12478.1 NADH-quinone oxidoreductase subunit G [Intrasporangium calvum]
MTATSTSAASSAASSSGAAAGGPANPDLVGLTIDGVDVSVPKGTLVIRAAETIGIEIPRFCDHPLLEPVGACRQCLVDVALPDKEGVPRAMPKPQASCTMTVSPGMVVNTQHSSPVADKAQQGVMELLLINHPLDCPVCDKGGECPLQNQAMSNGRAVSRFEDVKRTYPKPINISSQVLLDRERCVLCARCTRFSDQIAGDPFIALVERGALQQVGIYEEQPFESYFSGNTVQICPVGALTGAAYRFRSRPFDLVSTPSVCEHCASGCAIRTDHRRGVVLRRMALRDPEVNEEWNCDKGRWAFTYATQPDRIEFPMVRQPNGELKAVGWPEALAAAAAGLAGARAGVLVGGRVSTEDAYAYGKFARVALGTNDIDFRSRPHSAEEVAFLAEHVAATGPDGGSVTYADLEKAGTVLLVGFEPEDESPIVFLRLRKAFRRNKTKVYAAGPVPTRGLAKVGGTLIPTVPGQEAATLRDLRAGDVGSAARDGLAQGGIILVGERAATSPGALAAVAQLAAETGARLAWVPRRAGERGALEAGALGALLPGGRPTTDAAARREVAAAWDVGSLPDAPARDTAGIIAAAASGDLDALVLGGVDPADLGLADTRNALEKAFVISLEIRESAVTQLADVVLPVAAQAEKEGSYVNWEGRVRSFEKALTTNHVSDHRALDMLAGELGHFLATRTKDQVHAQFEALGPWSGARGVSASGQAATAPVVGDGLGDYVLATWPTLLDRGRMQDGEPFLAGTAPAPAARLSPGSAERLGVPDGGSVTVTGPRGSVTVPALVTAGMVDGVVWLPTSSLGVSVRAGLGSDSGRRVSVTAGDAATDSANLAKDGVA